MGDGADRPARTLALIVNPIAGIGGRVGLKGSDGADVVARARALGASSPAPARAVAALQLLTGRSRVPVEVIGAEGEMGGDAARAAGLAFRAIHAATSPTTGADTRAVALAAAAAGADLLLFVGGDGTAADLLGVSLPVLGVPAGVKMYSSVFATGPGAAADIGAAFLARPDAVRLEPREVMDVEEAALRRDERSVRLLGTLRVPASADGLQSLKAAASIAEPFALAALAHAVAARVAPGELAILGPGTTLAAIARELGVAKTLLGVDVVEIVGPGRARLVAADVSEAALLAALSGRPATILVSPTGGQGFVLGRGNQQLSPRVLRAVGTERLVIVVTPAKLAELGGRALLVDTGDEALDRALAGHRRIIMGPGHEVVAEIRPV